MTVPPAGVALRFLLSVCFKPDIAFGFDIVLRAEPG